MFGALLAKLVAVETRARGFLATIQGQIQLLEREIETIDQGASALLDRVDAKVKKASSTVETRITSAQNVVKKLES